MWNNVLLGWKSYCFLHDWWIKKKMFCRFSILLLKLIEWWQKLELVFDPLTIIKITFFDRWKIPNSSEIPKSPMINDSKLSSQVNFVSCEVRRWSYKFLILTWAPLIVYQQDWVTLYRSMWGHQKVKNSLPKKPNHFQVKMVSKF